MALVRLAVAAAIAIAAASPALAAPTFTQPDTSLLPAFVEAVRVAIEEVRPDGRTDPNVGRAVERLRRVERATAQAPPVELLELGRATRPSRDSGDWMSREHWLRLDVDSLKWFYGSYLEDRVIARPDTTVSATIERRVQAVRHADLVRAQREGLARLRRYEVKYGPGSPRLNVVEVLLAYSTSYATIDRRDDTRPVSVLEAGVRRYTFGWDPDSRSVWARMLKPRYGSLGVAIAERRDGALRWPLSGAGETSRVGPFLTWGDLKVAVLLGPDSRFLLSRQMHLLPNLF
jgi:hypothetical protein